MGWLSTGVLIAIVLFMSLSYLQRWLWPSNQSAANVRPEGRPQDADERIGKKQKLDTPSFTHSDDSEADDSSPSTPKADGATNGVLPDVPTFNLDVGDNTQTLNGKATEALKTLPNASKPTPSPAAAARNASAAGLMPPPAVKASALRPLPKAGSSLNPPPSAASRLRAPPGASLQPSLGVSAASASTLPPSQRPSRKVVLEPGHSPLDWAMLTRNPPTSTFLRGADIPSHLIKVPPSELKKRNGRKGRDAWGTWQGKVYNLTPYVKFHPGGVGEIMRGAGRPGESERLFNEIHPWVNWDNMLGECLVGILVSEPEVTAENIMESVD